MKATDPYLLAAMIFSKQGTTSAELPICRAAAVVPLRSGVPFTLRTIMS